MSDDLTNQPYQTQPLPDNLIVCAANRNIVTGEILLGIRHWDSLMQIARKRLPDPGRNDAWEQGFIDKFQCYHSRTEAWIIAVKANQLKRRCGGDDADGGTLYSENLY